MRMPTILRALFVVLVVSLVGCAEQATPEASALASQCVPSQLSTYVIDSNFVTYADAESRCVELGGHLAEFDSTAEIQAVFDAWVSAQYVEMTAPPSEAIWVGTWITSVSGDEWGYAMVRGGALFPVEQDGDAFGLAACEITSLLP